MNSTHAISASGAVVYWQLHDTDRAAINGRLAELGFDRYMVAPRTDAAALKAAIRQTIFNARGRSRKFDKIILELENSALDGYEVRNVKRGPEENEVSHDFSVKIGPHGFVEVTRGQLPEGPSGLQMLFEQARRVAPATAVAKSLISIIERDLEGVVLRANGGVYWVPQHHRATLDKLAAAIEAASQTPVDGRQNASTIYRVSTMIDEGTIRAVKDAIVAEVTAAADAMRSELAANDFKHSTLERRQAAAAQLHGRVSRYEEILGEALTVLHDAISAAETEVTAAMAQLEDKDHFHTLFS
jgi:hypothetical protein